MPTLRFLSRLAAGFAISIGGASAVEAEEAPITHLLAIGVCPPWKLQPLEVCENGVSAISDALGTRLGIADENIVTLVNAAATAEGLQRGLARFQDLGPSDRLIVFANLHAGALNPQAQATPENDVLVFWTENQPVASPFAVAGGDWVTAIDFAAQIHTIPAGEIIIILDACESDAVSPLFVSDHPENDEARPEAVITSAHADQSANFNSDRTMALFTQELAKALSSAEGSLSDAVSSAVTNTTAAALPICDANASQYQEAGLDPFRCRQQPVVHDPTGLLAQIALSD